jgi:16S rRNA (uracil1498-N3)-methyltransferase
VHRCWLGEIAPLTVGDTVLLSPEESAHVTRVLRMLPGEKVQLIAAERLYAGELIAVDATATTARVLAELPSSEAVVQVTLVQGLPKADKMEMIIQKATELGVWDVLPVEMERSVARFDPKDTRKLERWNRVAREAAKQSGRARVPEVRAPLRMAQAVKALQAEQYDAVLIAWEEEGDRLLSKVLARKLMKSPGLRKMALVIGPEGGITPAEVEALTAIGAESVSLGRHILRTETAGLCALAITMSALGEM